MDSLTSGELGKADTANLPFASNSIKKQVQINEANNTRLGGTQTRRDLEDLEQVYQNFANYTDSGLNTMIKSNLMANESFDRSGRVNNDRLVSTNESNGEYNSDFGLRAVNLIKEEMEKKALEQVLQEIENQRLGNDNRSMRNETIGD